MESALTLPLVVFLVLGSLQLFLMLNARIMAQYAVFRATRAGSVSQGDCKRMMHAAIATLLPAFARTDSPDMLGDAFKDFRNNKYAGKLKKFNGDVLWLIREAPASVTAEDADFDQGGGSMRLEMRLVFWYPLRIPFADWVMTKMFRASFAIQDYNAANPLILTQKNANWKKASWMKGPEDMEALIRDEYKTRTDDGEYVFPIVSNYSMRMMTPAKPENFTSKRCTSP